MNTSTVKRKVSVLLNRSRRSGRSDSGETLIEVIIALVIIGLSVVALLGGLVSSLTSSSENFSLTNVDSILRNYAEAAKYDIQQQKSPAQFVQCATGTTYHIVTAPEPASAPVGVGVQETVFGSGFTAPGSVTVTIDGLTATILSGATVNASGNFAGSVATTFNTPAIPAGSYPVIVAEGATTEASAGDFTVVPWVGSPTPSSRLVAQAASVNITGFDGSKPVTGVTVGGVAAPFAAVNTGGNGSVTVNFTVPAVPNGSWPVSVTEGSNTATSVGKLFVGPGTPPPASTSNAVTSSSLVGYSAAITQVPGPTPVSPVTPVMWWNTSTKLWDPDTGTCLSADQSGIQMITVLASGPNGVADHLSFVVTDPANLGTGLYPTVTSASPASLAQGAAATSVTITGGNFGATAGTITLTGTGDSGVTLGSPTSWSNGSIQVPVTVSATATVNTNWSFTVTNSSGNSGSCNGCFAVTPAATFGVTSISSPNAGGNTAGKVGKNDIITITFNESLNSATVPVAGSTGTIYLCSNKVNATVNAANCTPGSTTSTNIVIAGTTPTNGITPNTGFTVPTLYWTASQWGSASGTFSYNASYTQVIFTITTTPTAGSGGAAQVGTAQTFTYNSLATIQDVYGTTVSPAFAQTPALQLF